MDKKQAIEIVRNYAEVVKKKLSVKKVILYGSHAKENAGKDSDIDVAVVLDSIEDDYLSTGALLFKLSRDIDLRIEPVLVEQGDDVSGFLDEITKTGEVVYSAD
ncbi:MAG: nucleotidyltransferase domain-containing protein [Deltaproteobacteria bacterium]|nr:nucleotidyltransferase domain-containing protein [Deltaproteobacteria bacterium]